MSTTLGIRIDAEMSSRLSRLAEQTGRTKIFYVREVLNKYLEDLYLSEQALINVHSGKSKVYTLDDLRKII